MMMAQKFTAPKMARTLRDICSDSEACPVKDSTGSTAGGPGGEDAVGQRPCPHGHSGPGGVPVWVPGSLSHC